MCASKIIPNKTEQCKVHWFTQLLPHGTLHYPKPLIASQELANQDYVGPMPVKQYYCPEGMFVSNFVYGEKVAKNYVC